MSKLIVFLAAHLFLANGIYDFPATAIEGTPIHFSDFRGKKILIVNTASNSPLTKQYAVLEQLYQQYKDSLVVIAFPCDDFHHEGGSEPDIQNLVQNTYHIHFLLAGKTTVTGAGQSDLYKWLTTGAQNGVMTSMVSNDFQKYLVGSDGHLIGYFTGAMDPMDSTIVNLIK